MDWTQRLDTQIPLFDMRLFEIAGTPITIATLAFFVLVLLVTFLISATVQRAVVRALKLRGITDEGTVQITRRILHYALIGLGLAIAIHTVGINLNALFATGAFLAIGVGFALQNILQNFVAGVILLVERSIKPGDVLRVEGLLVRVVKMGIRATIVRSLDEEELIVPNASIVQSTVTNYTLRDSLYRLRCPVGVVYASDMGLVKRTLEEVARSIPWRHAAKDPVVLLTAFGDSSVNFEVSVWMDDPWRVRSASSDVNERIWWALKDSGVTIAFPQLDVHFDPPVVDSLKGLARAS